MDEGSAAQASLSSGELGSSRVPLPSSGRAVSAGPRPQDLRVGKAARPGAGKAETCAPAGRVLKRARTRGDTESRCPSPNLCVECRPRTQNEASVPCGRAPLGQPKEKSSSASSGRARVPSHCSSSPTIWRSSRRPLAYPARGFSFPSAYSVAAPGAPTFLTLVCSRPAPPPPTYGSNLPGADTRDTKHQR